MPDLLLGLDLGTSAVKVLLVDARGLVVAEGGAPLRFETPRPLWAEQDPDLWWSGAVRAIRATLAGVANAAERIACIGLAGQMHGLTLIDARGATLRPCILWNDQRSHGECAALERDIGVAELVRFTGNRVFPGFTLPKLLWVRANEPAIFGKVAQVLLPKDWLRWRLTGEFATDVADASGTALFDVGARRWSRPMADRVSIDHALLPRVFESSEIVGSISRDAAEATGLRAGTPVVAGAGDQAASAVGMGIVDEGQVSATIGTSGVIFAARRSHVPDPQGRLHAFCHAAPGTWHQMGVMLAAGGALRWFRDVVARDAIEEAARRGIDAYEVLAERAATVPAGCEGLVFLPYLSGERTPHADPEARGAFVGLTIRHTAAHLARAVFEGVTFGLRDCLDLVRGGQVVASFAGRDDGGRSPLARAAGEGGSPKRSAGETGEGECRDVHVATPPSSGPSGHLLPQGGSRFTPSSGPSGHLLPQGGRREGHRDDSTPIALAGGGARSPFWRQLCADVFGCDVVATSVPDAGALGAARLAAVGARIASSLVGAHPGEATPTCARTIPSTSPIIADELATALDRYRSLYGALRPADHPK